MPIAELFTALDAYKAEYQALLTQVEDLKNQILTAELQHGNDQKLIADLGVQLRAAEADIAVLSEAIRTLKIQLAADDATIASLQVQLAALPQAAVVYDRLESKVWTQTSSLASNVGGSGLGTASQVQPGIECAEFSIKPDRPVAPATSNYYDCYYHLDFPVDDTKTRYRLSADWMFPLAADAAASQCLEMEARQVVGGKMFIVACQLTFSGNQLRYWDATTKWTASGVAQPRLVPGKFYTVTLDGHRDATTVYHDSITINGVVTKLGKQYQAQATTWRSMIRCALQLDGNGKGDAYRVKIDNVSFKVTQ